MGLPVSKSDGKAFPLDRMGIVPDNNQINHYNEKVS